MSTSPRNAYLVMGLGAVLVLGLVGWALMRSFNAPVQSTLPVVQETAPLAEPAQDAEHAAVPRMSVEDLHQKLARNEVTLIDVRDADSYRAAHIAGALQIPMARIEGEVPYLPKGKPIVTYCT
jgi:3-mercaptopyruvate sulfurtransferase SseA